jgi:hypothetical protein
MKKTIRKSKKFVKKNKNTLTIVFLILILAFAVTLLFNDAPQNISQEKESAKYELTETDIFASKDFNANEISVMGLRVGDRLQNVLESLGQPDIQTDYPGGITNLEYSEALGLESVGLIIHVNNGFVQTIIVREPFNEFLIGETKIDQEKKDIYLSFGKPDSTIFMPIKQDSALLIRVISYKRYGLEFLIRKDQIIGFTLKLNDYQENQ